MRKLASIQRIEALDPIENADAILKATVLGWEVVVGKKDNFKVGDLVVYVEIDSILPAIPAFEFLRERKYRIRTIKLRGQVSQGIVFPLSILEGRDDSRRRYDIGDDVTEVLGVNKYDPQALQEQLEAFRQAQVHKNRLDKFFKKYAWYRRLVFRPSKLPFPKFIPKTDETRIQNLPHIPEKHADTLFYVTEKLDGQSFTAFVVPNPVKWQFWKPYIFGVCSRNFQILREDTSSYWEMVRKYDIKSKLIAFVRDSVGTEDGVYIQGEILGPGIQQNKYKLTEKELVLFQAAIVGKDEQRYDKSLLDLVCWDLEIRQVPCMNMDCKIFPTVKEIVEDSKGTTVYVSEQGVSCPGVIREGLVWRSKEANLSFKAINPDFLLKNEDA